MNRKTTILGIIIIIVVCILTTGCWFYNLLEPDDFKNHFKDLGYSISDKETAKYESDKYLVATKDDVPFKIEYYEFKNENEAQKVYKKFKDTIKDYITTDSKNNETTGAVFAKTIGVSENEYIVISRVKHTLIFIAGTKDQQKEIDKILEDIEY